LFLGITPLKPVEIPAGRYVLFMPTGYTWEHEGPIEVNVAAGQKTFFQLKLFRRYRAQGEGNIEGGPNGDGPSGGRSGAGGGSGSGGSAGTLPVDQFQ